MLSINNHFSIFVNEAGDLRIIFQEVWRWRSCTKTATSEKQTQKRHIIQECFHDIFLHSLIVNFSTWCLCQCVLWNSKILIQIILVFNFVTICYIKGHSAEIICLSFNTYGTQLLTGSFDHTCSVWDVKSGR